MGFAPGAGAQNSDVFFPRPAFGQPGLSTDGSHVVVTDLRKSPNTQLLVLSLSENAAPYAIDTGDLDPVFARWVSADRLMIYAVKRSNFEVFSIEDKPSDQQHFIGKFESQLIFVDSDGSNRVEVPQAKIDPRQDGLTINDFSLGPAAQGYVGLFVKKNPKLVRIDITDGSVRLMDDSDKVTITMRLASDGEIWRGKKSGKLHIETAGGAIKFPYEDYLELEFQGYAHNGETLFVSYRKDGADKEELYKIGPQRKILGPLASHERTAAFWAGCFRVAPMSMSCSIRRTRNIFVA